MMGIKNRNKKRGISILEIVLGIGIIAILTTYSYIKYQRIRYKNAMDSDRIKILTTINNVNVMSTVLPKNLTVLPKYVKFVDSGIIVADDIGGLEVDKGFNTTVLKDKGVSILFNCAESSAILKSCPLVVFYSGDSITVESESRDNNPNNDTTTIPSNIENKTARNGVGFIEFTKGSPEVPFTVYTFDENGIAKNRIKFSTGEIMKTSIYEYRGPKLGESGAWTREETATKNLDKDVEETAEWKKENLQKLPLKIEIK